ncbi:DUF7347 domain-containing protein [Halopiger goleimassiliensis]|uniref:DUF7347 domain-containing protein n=1 Tax=Halopiger goleimassiliensis TaxID=1293048 RepID=UPI0006776EA8|nr:hypothetical protein [Halopiger goleimassiliensis]
MAIPTWSWAGRAGDGADAGSTATARATPADGCRRDAAEAAAADVDRLSSEFDLLSSPIRLEILLALAEADDSLRYTDLREAISIEDNGKLNYHLRRLDGLVTDADGAYDLTDRGRRLAATVRRR